LVSQIGEAPIASLFIIERSANDKNEYRTLAVVVQKER
jgi:hypothetical protein